MADVAVGTFIWLGFPIGYFADKSVSRIASDLAFVEGAVIFFAGALTAFFRQTFSPTVKAVMVLGAAMVGLSVVFGLLG